MTPGLVGSKGEGVDAVLGAGVGEGGGGDSPFGAAAFYSVCWG